jgi:hypothetical protein
VLIGNSVTEIAISSLSVDLCYSQSGVGCWCRSADLDGLGGGLIQEIALGGVRID